MVSPDWQILPGMRCRRFRRAKLFLIGCYRRAGELAWVAERGAEHFEAFGDGGLPGFFAFKFQRDVTLVAVPV